MTEPRRCGLSARHVRTRRRVVPRGASRIQRRLDRPDTTASAARSRRGAAATSEQRRRRSKTGCGSFPTTMHRGPASGWPTSSGRAYGRPRVLPEGRGRARTARCEINTDGQLRGRGGNGGAGRRPPRLHGGRDWARKGLAINGNTRRFTARSPTPRPSWATTKPSRPRRRMIDLSPDTDVAGQGLVQLGAPWRSGQGQRAHAARPWMPRLTQTQHAFTRYYLGELALNSAERRPKRCGTSTPAFRSLPTYAALLEGKAKAECRSRRLRRCDRRPCRRCARVPQPAVRHPVWRVARVARATARRSAVLALRDRASPLRGPRRRQSTSKRRCSMPITATRARGRVPRPDSTLARSLICTMPTHGRFTATAGTTKRSPQPARALSLGTRNALFEFHAGMIENRLGNAMRRASSAQRSRDQCRLPPTSRCRRAATLRRAGTAHETRRARIVASGSVPPRFSACDGPARSAHPLGNFTVNHYDGLVIRPTESSTPPSSTLPKSRPRN